MSASSKNGNPLIKNNGLSFRDSSLTYFLVSVVLYLEIVRNIDQMHKSTFSYYLLIETT